jgi:hypothetical protein
MEDVTAPGFKLVYDGSRRSSTLSYSVLSPTISASKTYKFQVAAVACGMTSPVQEVTVRSGSVPSAIPERPVVFSYKDSSTVAISFVPPTSNGGYAITEFRVYLDNAATPTQTLAPIGPHTFELTGLPTLGASHKVQVSSVNAIGESSLSNALVFIFANAPSTPQSLTAASTETSIILSWAAPASTNGDVVAGYKIYINDGTGSEPVEVLDTSGTPSQLSATLMTNGDGEALE